MSRLLYIEPQPVVRQPLAAILQQQGYTVDQAASAEEGLGLASVCRPDLIITELALPGASGLKFLQAVRKAPGLARTPVLILSSVTDRPTILKAVGFSISGYLLKGAFSLSQFLQQVSLSLRKQPGSPRSAPAAPPPGAGEAGGAPQSSAPGPTAPSASAPAPPLCARSGESGELLAGLRPIVSRAEMDEALERCIEMKALSPAVGHLMKLTSRDGCSIDQIVDAVKMDHAIAIRVLKLANSTVYTRGDPVDNVKKAVLRIGNSEIRQAVMNIAVIDRFTNPALSRHLDCHQFWEHAIATAIIATELGRLCGRRDLDGLFTLGLLHDVGRMIFAEHLGERYAHVVQTARELNLPLEQVEKRMLLRTHADIMEKVLAVWNFPRSLAGPLSSHHLSASNLRSVLPGELEQAGILAMSNRLAHALLLGSSGNDAVYGLSEMASLLGLDATRVLEVAEAAPEQTNTMKFAMLSTSDTGAWVQKREQVMSQLAAPLRPVYAGPQGVLDGLRLFVDRLRQPVTEEDRPNIGIVKIQSAREIVPVTQAYIKAEGEAGAGRLPLVCVSPTGKLMLEKGAMEGRPAVLMPIPFTVKRFVDVVNDLLGAGAGAASAAGSRAAA